MYTVLQINYSFGRGANLAYALLNHKLLDLNNFAIIHNLVTLSVLYWRRGGGQVNCHIQINTKVIAIGCRIGCKRRQSWTSISHDKNVFLSSSTLIALYYTVDVTYNSLFPFIVRHLCKSCYSRFNVLWLSQSQTDDNIKWRHSTLFKSSVACLWAKESWKVTVVVTEFLACQKNAVDIWTSPLKVSLEGSRCAKTVGGHEKITP